MEWQCPYLTFGNPEFEICLAIGSQWIFKNYVPLREVAESEWYVHILWLVLGFIHRKGPWLWTVECRGIAACVMTLLPLAIIQKRIFSSYLYTDDFPHPQCYLPQSLLRCHLVLSKNNNQLIFPSQPLRQSWAQKKCPPSKSLSEVEAFSKYIGEKLFCWKRNFFERN